MAPLHVATLTVQRELPKYLASRVSTLPLYQEQSITLFEILGFTSCGLIYHYSQMWWIRINHFTDSAIREHLGSLPYLYTWFLCHKNWLIHLYIFSVFSLLISNSTSTKHLAISEPKLSSALSDWVS